MFETRGADLKLAARTLNSRRGPQTRGADLKLAARTLNSRRGPQIRGADLKLAARMSKLAARMSKTRGADVYNSRRGFVLTKHRNMLCMHHLYITILLNKHTYRTLQWLNKWIH